MNFCSKIKANIKTFRNHLLKRKESKSVKKSNKYTFFTITHINLGFRECMELIKLSDKLHCKFTIIHNNNVGTSDSILSLAKLGLHENDHLVFILSGENLDEMFKKIHDRLSK